MKSLDWRARKCARICDLPDEVGRKEYWIIDRFRHQMTVVRRKGKKFVDVVIREKDVYTTPLLPGFELPLKMLLAVADALARAASDDNDVD